MDTREETKKRLNERSQVIKKNMDLVEQTKKMYEELAPDLATSIGRFDELANSLSSSQLRIAVLGEYSRGKSSILNALLDMEELPTAQQETTAINTFIHGLPNDAEKPYLKIAYVNGKEEILPLQDGDVSTLEKWGTELVTENKSARQEVDHIDLYIDNDLLKNDLVLIDTPGLEGMQPHHQKITEAAIASAHMALWVQSVQQLGGNATEWNFLRNTLAGNFRKFITLINWWDLVLDPQDKKDKEKTPKERETEKLAIVRRNFKKIENNIPPEALETLISSKNLFGISAKWAQSDDPQKRSQSGIDKLYARINEIAVNEEDREEILYKPLKQLSGLQSKLQDVLEDRLDNLNKNDNLEKRKRDLENLKLEIRGLEQESRQREQDTQEENRRLCDNSVENIEKDLVGPLLKLKEEIDVFVTPEYVNDLIKNRVTVIDLPPDLKKRYDEAVTVLGESWQTQRAMIEDRLNQLNMDFAEKMNKYMNGLNQQLAALNVELPKLDIEYKMNFAPLEQFYIQKQNLEQLYNSSQMEMERIENEMINFRANEEAVNAAKEAVRRAEAMIMAQGTRPAPTITTSRVKVSDGGWYSSAKYETRTHVDKSAQNEYDAKMKQLEAIAQDREQALKRIQEEEFAKRGERISREAAQKKLERQLAKLEKEIAELQKMAANKESEVARSAYENLLRSTSGQLQKFADSLTRNAVAGVKELFRQNLDALKKCVSEQIIETVNAKKQNMEETISIIEKGEKEIEQNRQMLGDALAKLKRIQEETQASLKQPVNN